MRPAARPSSTFSIVVVENSASAFAQTIQLCEGESYTFNGNTYTNAGIYVDTLIANNGCDSLVTTTLNVFENPVFGQNISICAGDSYTFNGHTYTEEGVYTDTLTAANGCDSLVTTNLSFSETLVFTQTITLCTGESYTIGPNTYSESGFTPTFLNQ